MVDLDTGIRLMENVTPTTSDEACETLAMWLNTTPAFQQYGIENFSALLVNFTVLRNPQYSIPVYGYVTPLLFIIVLCTNTIVVAVLSRPHMRSPTNFILCVMAISDLLTLGIPVPMFIYQYTAGFHPEPVPCYLAYLNMLMTDTLPTVCHSASVWMTVLLAFQRYIYVCHPTRARTWCTVPRVMYATICLYGLATAYNIPRLFEKSMQDFPMPWKCRYVSQCTESFYPWSQYYLPVFYWFRVLCVNCLPCVLLVILNTLLVISLNEAQANRKRLFSERKQQESSKQRDNTCTTMMLVAVVCVFLIVELPLAVIVLLVIVQNTWELDLMNKGVMTTLITFSNLCIGLSYIIYFPIYCSMSRQFRETFKELFIKAKQLSHETVRNGRTTQRKNMHLSVPNAETYLTQADDVECTKTDQISRANNADEDETAADAAKETETLL
ncbi:sex peptide receptor-like [Paramacrobiotus metropolitanus]|uniref:sex peptide receptor-like n=1 Tax=Paramacrobiotus metropolitanus TaxID=2943436 RepID=UPI002445C861|nr:sex peptide receptor-like [Paramacrobiotus metropolitanus]XP_055338797.1 sex peptide receptor-like [Paramacrobiotus metropolitanus]